MAYIPNRTRALRVLLLAGAALFAGAQSGEEQKNTALLRIYPGLDQLVDRADALAASGHYLEALDIYAEAQKQPSSLVPVESKPPAPPRYVGVLEFCLRRIASWPAEGQAAYRRHADPLAGQAFQSARAARDPQALAEVALRYPGSSFADDALALLANLHLEAGRFEEAAAALERLLALPERDFPRAVAFARLGSAYARSGSRESLVALIARAERESPGSKIILGDREVGLAESLRTLQRTISEPAPLASGPASWEMMQGSASGVRVANPAEVAFRRWAARLDEVRFEFDEDPWGGFSGIRPDPDHRPVIPAVSDGIVYFHNEYSVQAWNLYSETRDPLWTHKIPVPAGELMFEDRLVHATSVADGRVFANLVTALGQPEVQQAYIRVKFPFPKRALFALDAYTGKVLWRVGGALGAGRFEDGLSFATPPTPYGGFLYASGVKQVHSTDPFEHHVLCLDPETGRILWSTFVASGGTEINLFGNSTRESLGSPLAVEGDTVYYGTNHGAFAALDRGTGRLRWVSKYRQLPVSPTRRIDFQRHSLEWSSSAPVIVKGLVIYTPTDSRSLFAYDAATGEARWSYRRGDNRSIAGCDGTMLVLAGEGVEWLEIAKEGKLAGRFEPTAGRPSGRAALTTEGVYFPTTQGLYRVALGAGNVPKFDYGPWRGSPNDGGNVIVAEGAVVVAGSRTVEVFSSRAAPDAAVEAELRKHPDRPEVIYRAALRLLQSGKDERAAELLGRVIELVAGSPRPADARLERAARKRLFAASRDAGLAALAAGKPAEAMAAFRRAAAAAPDIPSGVEAARLLADAAVMKRDLEAAIAEYQRLIRDLGDEVVSGVRVFDLSRAAIGRILAAGGRDAYKAFEAEAERRLKKAQVDHAPEALLDVFRSFPNSLAAERAVLDAAEANTKLGRSDDAASTLRLFLREFPGSDRALNAQAALVAALENRSRFGNAAVVLRRMAAGGSRREITIDGKRTTVGEFVEARLAREEYKKAEATTPPVRLSPPLKKAPAYTEREFMLGAAVLRPDGPAPARGAALLFLTFGGAVKAIDPASGTEAWRMATDAPVRTAFFHEDALILCSDSFIARVRPDTGAVDWKRTPNAPMKGFCRAGAMLCYLTSDPKATGLASVTALDPSRGVVVWSQDFQGLAVSSLLAADDHVALVTSLPNQILLFDAETGRPETPCSLASQGGGLRVLGVVGGVLLIHSEEGGLQAHALPSGARLWWMALERWSVTVMATSRAGLFVGGTENGIPAAMLIDPRNGKRKGVAENLDGTPSTPVAMDERRVVVAVRRGDRSLGVRSLDLTDSRLKTAWSLPAARGALQSVPLLAEGFAAVLHLAATPDGKFTASVDLLDPSGRKVQNIGSEAPLERPPSIALANDALILLVENRVEVYR